jgi:hypothetical protein
MAAEGSNNNTTAAGIRPPKASIIGEDGTYAWKLWEQQFNCFSISTQLDTKPEKVQAATLLATIGPDVIPVFNSFGLTEQEQEDVKLIRKRSLATQPIHICSAARLFTRKRNFCHWNYQVKPTQECWICLCKRLQKA